MRQHFASQTVYTCQTSVRVSTTASDLRSWLTKVLRSENPNTLEAPYESYALVFIDDVQLCTDDGSGAASVGAYVPDSSQDCPEEVIRGLLQGTTMSNAILSEEFNSRQKKIQQISQLDPDGVDNWVTPQFILHRGLLSDPKKPFMPQENFSIRPLGILMSATGDISKMSAQHTRFARILHQVSIICLPVTSSQDLHVILLRGLHTSIKDTPIADTLQDIWGEVRELAQYTINIHKFLGVAMDDLAIPPLERASKALICLNIGYVSRFCSAFYMAGQKLDSQGALLQLCVHEWKRTFYDPLPPGTLRDKALQAMRSQLDNTDALKWGVTSDWLTSLYRDMCNPYGSVWVDVRRIQGLHTESSTSNDSYRTTYVPLEVDAESMKSFIDDDVAIEVAPAPAPIIKPPPLMRKPSGTYTIEEERPPKKFEKLSVTVNPPSGWDLSGVIYPQAIYLLLRLVRILSVMEKNDHICLAGSVGAPVLAAITLATKICGLSVARYKGLDTDSVPDAETSNSSTNMTEFSVYIKACILRACGLQRPYDPTQLQYYGTNNGESTGGAQRLNTPVLFSSIDPERIALIITDAPHLRLQDRKLILRMLDLGDAISIFNDSEISGTLQEFRNGFILRIKMNVNFYCRCLNQVLQLNFGRK